MSLIELIVFIMIVSVALVALLRVMNITTQHGSDPMIVKQMQAIAEAYVEEVTAMPFTYCDPEDPNASTAASTANCTPALIEKMGPETVGGFIQTRAGGVNNAPRFNNVNDYGPTVTYNPASDASGAHTFPGYIVTVTVANDSNPVLGPAGKLVPTSEALHVTVQVTSGSNSLTLEAYRTRYAPTVY